MDCKRVTVIRIGPVISTRKKKHYTEMCGAFFVDAKRVRAQLSRESAVHGLQEGHRDQNRPGNLHQKEKALHRNVWCFFCFPIEKCCYLYTPLFPRELTLIGGVAL